MAFKLVYQNVSQPSHAHHALVVRNGRILSLNEEIIHRVEQLAELEALLEFTVNLGLWSDVPCHLYHLKNDIELPEFEMLSLRGLFHRVSSDTIALCARALQLSHWVEHNQYCGRCGKPSRLHPDECMMHCEYCQAQYYPVIYPCVIGLVTKGEQLLLAKNSKFTRDMYSVLAGFIEPGENAEQAFRREVKEEVGIDISNIRYVKSQSWPFPSQLMLGFFADYRSGDICVDGEEIIHAQWFDPQNLPEIPPPETISGQLIRMHIDNIQGDSRR